MSGPPIIEPPAHDDYERANQEYDEHRDALRQAEQERLWEHRPNTRKEKPSCPTAKPKQP